MTTTSKNNRSNEENELRQSIAELKRDAQSVREDLEHLRHDAASMTSHATTGAINAAKAGVDSASQAAADAGDRLKSVHESMNDQVRERPTASVLLALGTGVMLGRILAARR